MSQSLSIDNPPAQSSHPLPFLDQIANSRSCGYLNVASPRMRWLFVFQQGQLVYATHSIEPWDRLQRHLRRLSHVIPSLTREICLQIHLIVEDHLSPDFAAFLEYQGVTWLVNHKYLQPDQAQILLERMTEEVLESYILLSNVTAFQFVPKRITFPLYDEVPLSDRLTRCYHRLKQWNQYLPLVWSPFQRPYFFTNRYCEEKLTLPQRHKLSRILKGFSLRHLSALLNADELDLVKRFYPLIHHKAIILREPPSPFDQLPKLSAPINTLLPTPATREEEEITFSSLADDGLATKTWKVVCIDDSPTILKEIDRFLDSENLEVFTINDSLKALMQTLRLKPDLILMDVGMPNVDGYKLCAMLRKSPVLKDTPIIMVTGKTGLIDRARAKMVGATDYMTKPFTQRELLQIVFKYLT
jgi:twitching motility two-component system response regulator PilG